MRFDYNTLCYITKTNCSRLDCGESNEISKTDKRVIERFAINSGTLFGGSFLDSAVEYSCVEGYHAVPSTADTTHRCVVGGAWSFDVFECLKGGKS